MIAAKCFEFDDAMFISDLHLHKDMSQITKKFYDFLDWSVGKTKSLYILGDFFHAWPGDDALDDWSYDIARKIYDFSATGIKVYLMQGNRDFLLGDKFLQLSGAIGIDEPHIINFNNKNILLVHGDRYCTKDIAHQILRKITRNSVFKFVFLKIGFKNRQKIVCSVRKYSQNNTKLKDKSIISTVAKDVIKHLKLYNLDTVIHGHTHVPGLLEHKVNGNYFKQYILSDWDANPLILCYNKTNEFYYKPFGN